MLQVNENAKKSLNAVLIGLNAYETFANIKSPATIEGAFDNSFYINVGENNLLRVIKYNEFVSANSIVIDSDDPDYSFKSIGITKGMDVSLQNNNIFIGNKFVFNNIDKISKWIVPKVPEFSSVMDIETIMLNLRILRDTIYTCPSREGLVPLLENVELMGSINLFLKSQKESFVEKARPGIERTMWGLFSYDIKAVEESIKSIIGLGPGLTPSCDDFLAGLMLSLKIGNEILKSNGHDDESYFNEVAYTIYENARDKTTIFSLNMFREAREGICPLAELNLIYSLLTKDPNEVANHSKILIKMGETSGADVAIGIFYGIRFLVSRLENLEVIDATD